MSNIHASLSVIPAIDSLRQGALPERFTKIIDKTTLAEDIAAFLREPALAETFDIGGCVVIMLQQLQEPTN